jgi:hypothetical protein
MWRQRVSAYAVKATNPSFGFSWNSVQEFLIKICVACVNSVRQIWVRLGAGALHEIPLSTCQLVKIRAMKGAVYSGAYLLLCPCSLHFSFLRSGWNYGLRVTTLSKREFRETLRSERLTLLTGVKLNFCPVFYILILIWINLARKSIKLLS